MKIIDLPDGKIRLNDGSTQKYKINKKQKHIAKTQKGLIVVNNDFLKKSESKKKTIIYHERQHLKWFNRILLNLSRLFAIILFFSGIFSLLSLFKFLIIHTNPNLLFLVIFVSSFLILILVNYLNEIICDFNAVKNMGMKNLRELLLDYYGSPKSKNKMKNDFIFHPHWKWRIKIMGSLD